MTNIYRKVQKSIDIKNPSSGKFMEFDFWIPKYQLCFEFQVFIFSFGFVNKIKLSSGSIPLYNNMVQSPNKANDS